MKIDIFTTIAQIVNFAVLALLLRRFLYRPIVRTMDERERRIAADIEEARVAESRARRESEICHAERQELEDRRGEMLSHAQEEAAAWRRELMEKARREVEENKTRWGMAVEREKEMFLKDLRRRAGEEVYALARRALADLADVELERHIVNVFIERLSAIGGEEWAEIAAAASRTEEGAVVLSAFPLDGETRSRIRAAVERQIDRYAGGEAAGLVMYRFEISFEESPDLICGIELKAGGRRAAWSLENYLETLEERMALAFRTGGEAGG